MIKFGDLFHAGGKNNLKRAGNRRKIFKQGVEVFEQFFSKKEELLSKKKRPRRLSPLHENVQKRRIHELHFDNLGHLVVNGHNYAIPDVKLVQISQREGGYVDVYLGLRTHRAGAFNSQKTLKKFVGRAKINSEAVEYLHGPVRGLVPVINL